MARFRVVLTDESKRNIDASYRWIAERSTDGATRWYRALLQALKKLADEADRCPVAPESRHFDAVVRNLVFRMSSGRAYRVLFAIDGSEVQVLFVRGPGQDWVTP